MTQNFAIKASKLLILILTPSLCFSKDISSRFFYTNLKLAGLYGQDHALPNTNNSSVNIDLSDVEAYPATGTGLSFGLELMSSLPISFFAEVGINYLKDSSDSSVRRGVIVNSATLTRFKQKLRIYEVLAEGGMNVNLKFEKSILQFFGSVGVGTAYRFERLAYSSSDADIRDFLRESRSNSLMARLSAGLRYINQKRLFFEMKASLTDLTINQQDNEYTIINSANTLTQLKDSQELADSSDENQYLSLYLGAGYYF